jgi:hypothetical protein
MLAPSGQAALTALRSYGVPQRHEIGHVTKPICNTSGHRRSHAKVTMKLDEIVRSIIESNRRSVILHFARKSIAKARITPDDRPNRPVGVSAGTLFSKSIFQLWWPDWGSLAG